MTSMRMTPWERQIMIWLTEHPDFPFAVILAVLGLVLAALTLVVVTSWSG